MTAPFARLRDGIEPYDGKGDVASWLRQLEEVAAAVGVDKLERHIPCLLTKGAYAVYSGMSAAEKESWSAVRKALLAAFSPDCFTAFRELVVRRLGEGESVDVYARDIERLAMLVAGELTKCAFLEGLPEAARKQLRAACELGEMSWPNVVARARVLVKSEVAAQSPTDACFAAKATAETAAQSSADARFAGRAVGKQQTRPIICFRCGRPGHASRNCRASLSRKACFNCGDESHLAAACPEREVSAATRQQKNE